VIAVSHFVETVEHLNNAAVFSCH